MKERERGQGRVFLRGAIYWVSYYHRGKEHRESSYSTDESKALKRLRHRLKEIGADHLGLQQFAPGQDKIFVDELLDALEANYKLDGGRALPQFLAHLKPIRNAFGDLRAVDVTTARIGEYIDLRLKEDNKAPTTVNRETQLLGQAFQLARKRGELTVTPYVRRLPERNVRRGFFERAEFEAVLIHLPDYLQDFAHFAYSSGWRKGEIASLSWADVDREGRIIQLRGEHAKNGHARKLALEGELWALIERRSAAREYQSNGVSALAAWVFHRSGQPVGDFRKAWARACMDAGLPVTVHYKRDLKGQIVRYEEGPKKGEPVIDRIEAQALFHDLRRTAVRNLVRAGVREGVAMAISGHRTRSVFDRYNITSEDDLRDAVLRTQEHLQTQPAERKVVAMKK